MPKKATFEFISGNKCLKVAQVSTWAEVDQLTTSLKHYLVTIGTKPDTFAVYLRVVEPSERSNK